MRPLIHKVLLPLALLLTICFCGSAISCKTAQQKANSPGAVATKFMKHLGALEFDEARKLCTESSQRMIDMLQSLYELGVKQGADQSLEKQEVVVNIVNVAIDGNAAVVTYTDKDEKVQTIDLVKEKGKWLVDMKKENTK
jgi:hypothetical protein